MTVNRLVSTCFSCLLLAPGLAVAEAPTPPDQTTQSQADFERIKSLAGTWQGIVSHHDEEPGPATVTYAVTAGGSAVVETEFPGTEHEMVTVYTLDGDRLVLTHYCMLGNQPKMAAQADDDPDVIRFDFTGGANIETGKEFHMRKLAYTFIDEDHLTAEWTSYVDGQPGPCAVIDLHRKRD